MNGEKKVESLTPSAGSSPPTLESVGLQAKFDQMEAALEDAHRHVDRMAPRDDDSDKTTAAAGAEAAAGRCGDLLQQLNTRLDAIAERVGAL